MSPATSLNVTPLEQEAGSSVRHNRRAARLELAAAAEEEGMSPAERVMWHMNPSSLFASSPFSSSAAATPSGAVQGGNMRGERGQDGGGSASPCTAGIACRMLGEGQVGGCPHTGMQPYPATNPSLHLTHPNPSHCRVTSVF